MCHTWLTGCRIKGNCPLKGPWPAGGLPFVGVFLRDPSPHLREFRKKTTENSEQLGRQARPGFEPGTSRLPVLSVTTPPLVRLGWIVLGCRIKANCPLMGPGPEGGVSFVEVCRRDPSPYLREFPVCNDNY